MLQVRVIAAPELADQLARVLTGLDGVSNVVISGPTTTGEHITTADVDGGADEVLEHVMAAGVDPTTITLVRLESVHPVEGRDGARWLGDSRDGPVWVEVVGSARTNARLLGRYAALMTAAGVIASVGVLDNNQILIVGAMAISPDLLPMAAACVGVVGRRPRLALRAVLTLVIGLLIAGVAAAVAGRLFLEIGYFDVADAGVDLGTLTTTDLTTVTIALAAGVAGMLAFETRAGAAIGVAISLTTIPAVAYFGVVVGEGETDDALGALGVLATNVLCVIVAGSTTLVLQRWWRAREADHEAERAASR